MKISKFSTLLLLAVACSLGVTGCKKTPKSPTPIWGQKAQAPKADGSPSGIENAGPAVPLGAENTRATRLPGTGADGENTLGPREELGNYFLDRDMFKQQTVYFEFDRFSVKPSEVAKVQSVVSYLKDQPSFKVLVEGHCDERGTPEYNRALGERRALAIRENLIRLGLADDRIQTISYGEDKPADPGHDETAWAKNRRGEFVLMKPKTGATDAR